MAESNYCLVTMDKSYCPVCKEHVTLLCRKERQTKSPQFYICWKCKNVYEAGKGEVRKDED